jgi:hypothetical protein
VLVAQNPDRAEEFVRSITDDTLRTGALQELVLAIVEQIRGRDLGPGLGATFRSNAAVDAGPTG